MRGRRAYVLALKIGVSLVRGEAYVFGAELDRLALRAHPRYRQPGGMAARQHETMARVEFLDEPLQEVPYGLVDQDFEIVEKQRDFRLGERQAFYEVGREPLRRIDRLEPGQVPPRGAFGKRHAHGGGQRAHEGAKVVVVRLDLQPDGRKSPRQVALAQLLHQGRLAEAGGRANQGQFDVGALDLLDQPRSLHGAGRRSWRRKTGAAQTLACRALFHWRRLVP